MGNEADNALFVEFSSKWMTDPIASKEKGYVVEREVDFIREVVDSHTTIGPRPATDEDRERFFEQYKRFKSKASSQAIGIPLEKAPFLTPPQVTMYERNDVYTLEQLAVLSDNRAEAIGMGVKEHRAKAKEHLAMKKLNDPFEKQQKIIAELEARLKMLEEEKIKQVSPPPTDKKKSKEEHVNI